MDNRVMLPVRVLAEAFGADVNWDAQARMVSMDYDEQAGVQGPPGPQGPQGPEGAAGPQGTQGETAQD